MKIKRVPTLVWMLMLMIFSIILAACSPAAGPTVSSESGEPVTLRMAVLPILDALPMYVADQEGLFEAEGVAVEFIPVSSAAERDQVIAAGQADGMINDGISTLLYNQEQVVIQVVRFARTATAQSPQYFILAAGDSGITTVEGLQGVDIGVSQGTVIEYLVDRLLQAEGFRPAEIQTVAVPGIAERMSLLGSGELEAAMLPDPLASLAVQNGAVVVLDDSSHPEFGYSVISFRKAVIDENPEAVRAFLAAVEEATNRINADPNQWESILVENNLVPAPLQGSYQVPPFPAASNLSQAQWADVLEWAQAEGLVSADLAYEESVNSSFLP